MEKTVKKKEEIKDEKPRGPTIDDYFMKVKRQDKSLIPPVSEKL